MRLTFLLDENILYHAVRGVDEHNKPDLSAMKFLQAAASICHEFSVPHLMYQKYLKTVQRLERDRPPSTVALRFFNQLLVNSSKCVYQPLAASTLSGDVKLPREDIPIVEAARASGICPILVTDDQELRDAINNQPVLGLIAVSAREALQRAKAESP